MKTPTLYLAAWLVVVALSRASAQEDTTKEAPVTATDPAKPAANETTAPGVAGVADLQLNFRNASLDQVLNYLSEAAGFTIVLETKVSGTVDVWSNQKVTKEEAIEILDSALAKNGYAAIRDGKKLTVVSKAEATTRNIPIISSTDWETIPQSDMLATYIIPVRYINASQLIVNLQPLTPTTMKLSANNDSNSLLITDSQGAIRRIAHIASLLDSSVSSVSTLKIVPLKHADAKTLATTLTTLYSGNNSNNTGNRGGGGGQGGFGGGQNPFAGGQNPFGGGGRGDGGTITIPIPGNN